MNQAEADATPLHSRQPLTRFSNRAVDYAKYRPGYPEAVIAAILEGLGAPEQLIATDIGAGTGISSRLLANQGVRVLAIEPNAAMRQAAPEHPLVEFRDGTAEQTHLADASIDLVTCFQSFHWFEPEATLGEFHRILKRSGRLALVWHERDSADEFTEAYGRLVRLISNHNMAEKRLGSVSPLFSSPHFIKVHRQTFCYQQALDLEGLVGRARSTSYLPREGPAHQQLISGLQKLHTRFCNARGLVYLAYQTSVYLAVPHS